ncbi:MAG: hypothetical protein JRJ77_03930 [Deltaproteobacteria bacterium]|nr:hypothetical protein [Deltaproteobacteria bacterium]
MENKNYFDAVPGSDRDAERTAELKTFAEQAPAAPNAGNDHREEVMNRASALIKARTERTMLFLNLSYHEASERVFRADPELGELYARGYVRK